MGDRGMGKRDGCPSIARDPSSLIPASRSRVAIVHDWLTGMRGGEKVLEEICALYPDATLFTLVRVKGSVSPVIERHAIRTSWVQALPRPGRWYRNYLPLFPSAVESMDLDDYDLVISSSHCAVKSVICPRGRHAYLLLPFANAIRLGPVSGVFRPAAGRFGYECRCCGPLWRVWPGGMPQQPGGWTAFSLILNMLRAGYADTIIAGRPLCILQ